MKLTNNRFYFDYNATSPLDDSVTEFIKKGGFDFFNSSSIHQSGKESKKIINETRKYLFETFSLDESQFHLFFHSGATEGLNTLLLGHGKINFLKKSTLTYFYFMTDHPAAYEQVSFMKSLGHKCIEVKTDSNGDFDIDDLIARIKSEKNPCFMNYTYVNNLTGVIWPLEKARKLKEQTQISIHVDAVQSIGKVDQFYKIDSSLDCYTFSGHKFGALKGVGFSFVKKNYEFEPLLYGGGQEVIGRSGTQNTLGIYSLKIALKSLLETFNYDESYQAKVFLENSLVSEFGDKLIIVGKNALLRNNNTISLIFLNTNSKLLLTAFDMAGIDVSSGPACSSSVNNPLVGLLALGYDEDLSSSSIRFSFSTNLKQKEAELYFQKISEVLERFIS